MRWVIGAIFTVLPATSALAGGVGVLATGGLHTEKVYFYSDHSPEGVEYNDIADYDQFEMIQTLPNLGGGIEILLGDRDDKIMGSVRGFYLVDGAQKDPAEVTDDVSNPDWVVGAYRGDGNVRPGEPNAGGPAGGRSLGMIMVGMSWGIIGEPGGLQLGAVGHVGTSFLTRDHTEFFIMQVGPGVTYKVARQVQLFGELQYAARFRQAQWAHSGNVMLGARYLFD